MTTKRPVATAFAASLAAAVAWPATAQDVSDDAVKIGILNDMSGVYADTAGQGSVVAAELAIEDFGDTVLGKPIELISADHQNKADVGSNIAREWYDVQNVDAIMDLTTSSVALAVQGLSREKKKITITTGGGSTEITGGQCSPYGFHWAYNTRALSQGTAGSLVRGGDDTWFFVTADYTFGDSLQGEATKVIEANGGKVLGDIRHPLSTTDFSSFMLQAQSSGAKVIGLANAGLDTANAVKAATEFGLVQAGQKLAALLITLSEVHGLGGEAAQGLNLTEGWYWDQSEENRAFAKRYMDKFGKMPNMIHVGTYSAVLQYLKAVKEAGTDETEAVAKKLHEMPVEDLFAKKGKVLANGRMVYDMYLFQVKTQDESTGPWDLYKEIATVPGDVAFGTVEDSGCDLATFAAK
ncbi:ABC transporter substrate-binding protein [Aurantimonas sp. C2-6-R+9]|uniref:ABC transporter substrate-binding protein n=1 Tax=unclassified Aurantimonas TaxID=2638230 RepID=UPI002E181391|nr:MULTISPECIES: ABC transporter substrate-binding protein [unclassified Aurantimonas]MEC5289166.1 ABC transporter substrate-binding protein [Aurantimonas sp. C2-3-R2]MEC5382307.1 ABC transporter substrate-binding protein [Aurantimonas sp. C2-6-R+9]MEC5410384.1 ABC transporter substrate-binding protein [Aurantimonas sp. C2-4-R8]